MSVNIPSPEECLSDSRVLTEDDTKAYLSQLTGWIVASIDGITTLEKRYQFRDFADALEFTNRVGALAEEADHHPLIITEWGAVTVRWWSHSVQGLRLMDLAMAKRCESEES